MKALLQFSLALALVCACSGVASAQPDIFSYGGAPVDMAPFDDLYDGTLGSMACVDVDNSSGVVEGMTDFVLGINVEHTWVGDLTMKIVSPSGTVTTGLATPGQPGAPDDGSTCCGFSDDLDGTPLTFENSNPTDAEDMGLPGSGVVCTGDGLCDYFPNPDGAPGTDFSDFSGESAVGIWQFCLGDGAGGDTGIINGVQFLVNGSTVANESPAVGIPGTHALSDAYPNPFNPQTSFTLQVAESQRVMIAVYNALGRRIATLFDGQVGANTVRTFAFEASGLPSGQYVVRVQGEQFEESRQVTLLK